MLDPDLIDLTMIPPPQTPDEVFKTLLMRKMVVLKGILLAGVINPALIELALRAINSFAKQLMYITEI